MYNRPDARDLLEAARLHLEQRIMPHVEADAQLYSQTLMAIGVLQMVERELEYRPAHLSAQWNRLNAMQDVDLPLPGIWEEAVAALDIRNRELCHDIRAGRFDSEFMQGTLFEHLLATTMEQLQVANPHYLTRLAEEDTDQPSV